MLTVGMFLRLVKNTTCRCQIWALIDQAHIRTQWLSSQNALEQYHGSIQITKTFMEYLRIVKRDKEVLDSNLGV